MGLTVLSVETQSEVEYKYNIIKVAGGHLILSSLCCLLLLFRCNLINFILACFLELLVGLLGLLGLSVGLKLRGVGSFLYAGTLGIWVGS
jgi:FtsH-binding integral membrane protein